MHWIGRELAEVVTARAGAGVYRVENIAGEAVETRLDARLLPEAAES